MTFARSFQDLLNTSPLGVEARKAIDLAAGSNANIKASAVATESEETAKELRAQLGSDLALAGYVHDIVSCSVAASDADWQNPRNREATNVAVNAALHAHAAERDRVIIAAAGANYASKLRTLGWTNVRLFEYFQSFDTRGDMSADDWKARELTVLQATVDKSTAEEILSTVNGIYQQRQRIAGLLKGGMAGLTALAERRQHYAATVETVRKWAGVVGKVVTAARENKPPAVATAAEIAAAIDAFELKAREDAAEASTGEKTILQHVAATLDKLAALSKRAIKAKETNLATRLDVLLAHANNLRLIGDNAAQDVDASAFARLADMLTEPATPPADTQDAPPADTQDAPPADTQDAPPADTVMGAAMADALVKAKQPGRRKQKGRAAQTVAV